MDEVPDFNAAACPTTQDLDDSQELVLVDTLTTNEAGEAEICAYSNDTEGVSTKAEDCDTDIEDLLTLDVDPAWLQSCVANLIGELETLMTTLSSLRDQDSENASVRDLCTEVHNLYVSSDELDQIVQGFSRQWDPESGQDIDLDPSIHQWITNCLMSILTAQAEVERLAKDFPGQGGPLIAVDSSTDGDGDEAALQRSLQELQTSNLQLKEFLPIMKVTLNESLGGSMPIPVEVPDEIPTSATRHYCGDSFMRADYPRNSLEMLRLCLYELKDEFRKILDHFEKDEALDRSGTVSDLETELRLANKVLAEVLSNHGSEWIESMLGGKLTFSEFSSLDRTKIRRFTLQFRNLHGYGWVTEGDEDQLKELMGSVVEVNDMLKARVGCQNTETTAS